MRRSALALMFAAPLLAAQAPEKPPDKPPAQPSRDVTVEYIVQDNSDPGEPTRDRPLKVYWAGGGARMRIQMGDERTYVVLDRDARRMTMVLLDERGYVETPYDPRRQTGFTVPTDLVLMKGRNDVVAGTTCTLWHAKRLEGTGSVCVTEDGVLLREGYGEHRRGDLVATMVVYGPQPSSVFAPPAGFRKFTIGPPPPAPSPPAPPQPPDRRKPG